jgi:hypothetical protein
MKQNFNSKNDKQFSKNNKNSQKQLKNVFFSSLVSFKVFVVGFHACLEDFGKAIGLIGHGLPLPLLASLRHCGSHFILHASLPLAEASPEIGLILSSI